MNKKKILFIRKHHHISVSQAHQNKWADQLQISRFSEFKLEIKEKEANHKMAKILRNYMIKKIKRKGIM